jgi:hypothetical protein
MKIQPEHAYLGKSTGPRPAPEVGVTVVRGIVSSGIIVDAKLI